MRAEPLRGQRWVAASWLVAAIGLIVSGFYEAPAGMLTGLPVIVTAWFKGLRAAAIAGLASLPFTTTFLAIGGYSPALTLVQLPTLFGHVGTAAIGLMFGYSSDLRRSLEFETHRRARSERAAVQAEMEAQLLRTNRLTTVGTLAAGIAHEINNPLTFILGNLELASEELTEFEDRGREPALHAQTFESLASSIDEAREGAERIQSIVAELKLFVRERDQRDRGPVNLGEVFEAAVKLCRHELGSHIELIRRFELVPPVRGDAGKLAQIFVNLIVNAAQAMPESRGPGTIRLELSRHEGGVLASVIDDGPGMSEAVQAKIFEPFFTTKPVGVGTGLGLAVCASIVRDHGGSLSLATQEGEGAAFHLALPLAEPHASSPSPQPQPQPVLGGSLRMLIIEDDSGVRRTLSRLLEHDHDCHTAARPRRALELLLDPGADYDLVLCDLMMPELTGDQLYSEIVARRPALADKFWFMTGGGLTPQIREFISDNRARLIDKPVTRDGLGPAIQAALAAQHHQRAVAS